MKIITKRNEKWAFEIIGEMHKLNDEKELYTIFKNEIIKNEEFKKAVITYEFKGESRNIEINKKQIKNSNELKDIKNIKGNEKYVVSRVSEDEKISIILYMNKKIAINTNLSNVIKFFIIQLQLLHKIRFYKNSAVLDNITGLFNQEYLKNYISNEIERSKRYQNSFSIVFFDLDNLKKINEIHGHLIGTEILKEIGNIFKNALRKVDIVSRFGGDEFVIVLVNSDVKNSFKVCQRLRGKIKEHIFLTKENLNLKISGSFGISSFPDNGSETDKLIKKADLAMYQVKGKGKDGIKIYKGDE